MMQERFQVALEMGHNGAAIIVPLPPGPRAAPAARTQVKRATRKRSTNGRRRQ